MIEQIKTWVEENKREYREFATTTRYVKTDDLLAYLDTLEQNQADLEARLADSVVFSLEGVALKIGDCVELEEPNEDNLFYNSYLGKAFKSGKIDLLKLEAKRKDWLEVYFEATFYKEGMILSRNDYDGADYYKDNYPSEYGFEPYTESCDFNFLRYVLKKGGKKC